jgi:hypothetical protein
MDYQSPTQAITSDDSGIVEVWWLVVWCHGGANAACEVSCTSNYFAKGAKIQPCQARTKPGSWSRIKVDLRITLILSLGSLALSHGIHSEFEDHHLEGKASYQNLAITLWGSYLHVSLSGVANSRTQRRPNSFQSLIVAKDGNSSSRLAGVYRRYPGELV